MGACRGRVSLARAPSAPPTHLSSHQASPHTANTNTVAPKPMPQKARNSPPLLLAATAAAAASGGGVGGAPPPPSAPAEVIKRRETGGGGEMVLERGAPKRSAAIQFGAWVRDQGAATRDQGSGTGSGDVWEGEKARSWG